MHRHMSRNYDVTLDISLIQVLISDKRPSFAFRALCGTVGRDFSLSTLMAIRCLGICDKDSCTKGLDLPGISILGAHYQLRLGYAR
jgi:hypothetical protein